MSNSPSLLLIGPAAAGKSTVGNLAAEILGLPFVDLDEIGADYYTEVDWSIDRLVRRTNQVGRVTAEREWESARAHAVRRAIEDHPDSVLALGAGHTSYTDPVYFSEVQIAVATVATVVLLLPTGERESDLLELRRRSLSTKGTNWVSSGHDFLSEWVDDAGMHSLATNSVFTGADTPEETARRVAMLVRTSGHNNVVSSDGESWDILDAEGAPTGAIFRRGAERWPSGRFHLVVAVCVQREDGAVLLTQRAANKEFPLSWEFPGGSALAGESSADAASRELREESGLNVKPSALTPVGRFAETAALLDFYVARVRSNVRLTLQRSEVIAAEWVTPEVVEGRLAGGVMADPWIARLDTLWPSIKRALSVSL